MNLLFRPVGLIAGLIAGLLAKKIFDASWQLIDGEQPPEADVRHISTSKLVLSLALEGAIFALVKGLVDRGARKAFANYTGAWPGADNSIE
jgi:hypothetical protein